MCFQFQLSLSRTVSSLFSRGRSFYIVLVFGFVLTLSGWMPAQHSGITAAYVDPALTGQTGELSVVVTAKDSTVAAAAIDAVGGAVTSDLWLINAVGATISAEALGQLAAMPAIHSIVENKQVTTSSTFHKQQGAADLKKKGPETDLAWPVAKDVGADELHNLGLTGRGIGVAVIDSGVTFYKKLVKQTDGEVVFDYEGQFDFGEDESCSRRIDGYCFQKSKDARDPFGHGSHVAGIIGNGYRDSASGAYLGIAPDARIISFRALTEQGVGSYEQIIESLQAVSALRQKYNIRIVNLSLSATATVPYFVDPLNRAVEALWAQGIVVVAAAGNEGSNAETITTPGNDPYIITVGGLNTRTTAGDFSDDVLPNWSATGPTADGFIKPDVLAPGSSIVSFMYNAEDDVEASAYLARNHPDYALSEDLFRMSGTSMATAVTSGVVALMLQANPDLTPDEVKFRLMTSARPAIAAEELAYNLLQQGAGRIWAPDAVLGDFPAGVAANTGMDILQDLAHGADDEADLAYHYHGPIQRAKTADDNILYYVEANDGTLYALGAADAQRSWLSREAAEPLLASFAETLAVNEDAISWAGGESSGAGTNVWAGGGYAWAGGGYAWSGGGYAWSGGGYAWSGGGYAWSGGGYAWAGGGYAWAGGGYAWAGSTSAITTISSTTWVEEESDTKIVEDDTKLAEEPTPNEDAASPDTADQVSHRTFLPVLFSTP